MHAGCRLVKATLPTALPMPILVHRCTGRAAMICVQACRGNWHQFNRSQSLRAQVHGSRCARNAVKALLTALEGQQTLAQMQRSLGGARVRELAPGMRRK